MDSKGNRIRGSLRSRITRMTVLAVLLSTAALGGTLVHREQKGVEERVRSALLQRSSQLAGRLEQRISDARFVLEAAATEPGFAALTPARRGAELKRLFALRGIVFHDGELVVPVGKAPPGSMPLFEVSTTRCDMGFHDLIVEIPISRGSERLRASLCLGSLAQSVVEGGFDGHGVAMLADAEGRVIAGGPSETPDHLLPPPGISRLTLGGVPGIVAATRVPELGWTVLVEQPLDEAWAPVWQTVRLAGVGAAAAVLFFTLVAGRLATRITRALGLLREEAEALAAGQLGRRVEIRTGDELEVLGDAYNRMAEAVQIRDRAIVTQLAQLEEANGSLQESAREKQRMLAGVSHDIRQPLQCINGYAQLFRLRGKPPLTEEQEEFLGMIESAGQQVLNLANDLLELSRMEAGRLNVQRRPLPAESCVVDAMRLMEPAAGEKRIVLSADLPRPAPVVLADSGRVARILQNLLTNAVKFTPEGGRVEVGLRPVAGGTEIEFWVSDSGVGIAADDLERIFGEFERAQTRVQGKEVGGVGLGLSLVRRMVQAHGGRIWVESEVGVGSVFRFTLPRADGLGAPVGRTA